MAENVGRDNYGIHVNFQQIDNCILLGFYRMNEVSFIDLDVYWIFYFQLGLKSLGGKS